jgi:arginyl-tRNA synthetase
MLKKRILEDLEKAVKDLGYEATDIVCSIPKSPEFGEYTTNIPLQLAKQNQDSNKQSPVDIANEIIKKIKDQEEARDPADRYLEKVESVNGFINFYIKPEFLLSSLHKVCDYSNLVNPEVELEGSEKKKIMVEYASFNALKPVHVGHMRNITLGESVTRLLEAGGNKVFRVAYTSDIGLPSAKVVWALMQNEEEFKEAKKKSLREKAEFLGRIYVIGNSAYVDDEKAAEEIKEINKQIYAREAKVVKYWQEALSWTFEYFDQIYSLMGTRFDKEFLESEVEGAGKEIVESNIGKVFKESEGAVIFPGEEFGLHNRVFISSAGNPTYEAKDMALADKQYEAFSFDEAIHVVATDQDEYFKVIFKALEQLNPEIAKKEKHLSYGYVFLESGKMSSRTGNVITLEFVFDAIKDKIEAIVRKNKDFKAEEIAEIIRIVTLGALKFSILKYAPNTDLTFDIERSVSLQGDSGPYVQYTYARAKSVLRNAKFNYNLPEGKISSFAYDVDIPHSEAHPKSVNSELEKEERELLQKIEHFPTIVEEAASALHPNIIATYLLEMSSLFNVFYQKHQIISGDKTELRLAITCAVAIILKQGLYLLGIEAPERM